MPKVNKEQRLLDLIAAWPNAISLDDAFEKAGIPIKDRRSKQRLRRQAEQVHGVTLPSLSPKHDSFADTYCPSTLDVAQAKKAKGFITTSYTNNTRLVTKFLDTLEKFAEHHGFQILVKPIRYQNPTAMSKDEDFHWDKRIKPYVINDDFKINQSIVFSAASLQATTANPLAGKQIAYGKKSVIYGSGFLECLPVATPKTQLPKMLFATGSLNYRKYSNTNAGLKAAAKHNISAILVIPVGDYNRDYIIEWDGEGFSFFDEYWTPEGLDKAPASYEAIHFGDAHADNVTPAMIRQRMKLINHLNPRMLIWNDLHNHGAGSHHNTLIENIQRFKTNRSCVKTEVQMSVDLLNKMGKDRKNLIIGSNHHDHLEQWLNRFKPQNDLQNAPYYFWLMDQVANNPSKSALELAMQDGLKVDYEFVDGDKPYYVAGIDCSQHGHQGADGARSAAGFHNMADPIQTGHTHKRTIKGNHWTSGVIPLELGYNTGPGTWSSTDTPITTEGTRTHVTFIKGKYWK